MKVLFVPGFRDTIESHDYRSVMHIFQEKGYEVEFVPIPWDRTTVKIWVETLEKVYEDHNPNETILAGFSYGAVTAFLAAAERSPAQLWLFSMSDAFAEDLPLYKKSWVQQTGKGRMAAFAKNSFEEVVKKIHCPTYLFVGENEAKKYPNFAKRIREAYRRLKGSKLVEIPGTEHDVTDPRYRDAIRQTLTSDK